MICPFLISRYSSRPAPQFGEISFFVTLSYKHMYYHMLSIPYISQYTKFSKNNLA